MMELDLADANLLSIWRRLSKGALETRLFTRPTVGNRSSLLPQAEIGQMAHGIP